MLENLFRDNLLSTSTSAVVCLVLILILMRREKSNAFLDKAGRKMKEVSGDTRVRRFSHGRELSDEGYALGRGEPYIIRNGSRKEVVLSKPQHLREFFSGDGKEHWKAPDGNMGYFFHRLLGQCVGAQSGNTWREIRGLFDPIYTPAAMIKFTHRFRHEVQIWLDSLCTNTNIRAQDCTSFGTDVSGICVEMPLKLVAWTLYGEALSNEAFADLMELTRVREELGSNTFLGMHMISKIYAWLPTRANQKLAWYTEGFREFNLRMVAEGEKSDLDCPLKNILREINATGRLSMEQFLHTIDEILFENLDVASSALSYLLLNVASDVAIQQELRIEVAKIVQGGADDATFEAYLAKSDTFLELCCTESRRLCPAIWFTFCERSPSDKLIGEYYIPANTDITIDWKRINIDSPIWSYSIDGGCDIDGYKFYPARFSRISKTDCRYSLVGYGAGVRKCLGQHFSNLLMRLVLIEVISKYRITAKLPPWELGFRRDKFILTPNSQKLLFEAMDYLSVLARANRVPRWSRTGVTTPAGGIVMEATVKQDLAQHNDPPLDLASVKRHPLRDRYDEGVARALKCLSSSGIMLRALCDPDAWIHDMMFNFHDHTALFVACQADVANLLNGRALDSSSIAQKTGIEADKISRHLRALCNMHIFREVAPDVYENNELSLLFQSESRKALVGLCAEESRWSSCKQWDALTKPGFKGSNAVNKAAFNIAYETDLNIFEYWKQVRPDLGQRGARAFAGKGINHEQYLALYPWAKEKDGALVVDVGGGVGGATLPVVRKFHHLKLQVQDLPENRDKFFKFIKNNYPDVANSGRVVFQEQNFFEENVTKNADIYFLRHVIHDWPDPEATELLSSLATAMSPSSKVLICEHVVLPTYTARADLKSQPFMAPEPLLPNWGASFTSRLDLQVLACINAKQRSEADFESLAARAGFQVTQIWRNMGDEVIIECRLL